MALTLEEKKQWLVDDNEKIVLCDIEYHDGFSLKLAHFSNSRYITPYGEDFTWTYSDGTEVILNNIAYVDNMINIPSIISKIDADVNVGNIEFINSTGEYDYLINYAWEGHPLKLLLGDPSWARNDFIEILSGISTAISSTKSDIFSLGVRDKKEVFNKKLQTKKIYYNNQFDNYLVDLYNHENLGGNPAFEAEIANIISYSKGIPVYVSDGATPEQITKAIYDAIIAEPEFESVSPATGSNTVFQVQASIVGDVEDTHAYTSYVGDTDNITFTTIQQGTGSLKEITEIEIVNSSISPSDLNNEYFGIYHPFRYCYVWFNFESTGTDPEKIEQLPFYTQVFNPGTTGIPREWIPEANIDKVVPDCLGKCFNVEPVLVDAYNHVYQVADGRISEITEVRSNGVPLVKYPAPENENAQYEVNTNIGCIRLLVHDNNTQITCDVVGTTESIFDKNGDELTPATYKLQSHSAAYLIAWIALNRAGLLVEDICPYTFNYQNPNGLGMPNISPVGIFFKDETDIAPIITDIMASVGGFARFGRNIDTGGCPLQIFQVVDPDLITDPDLIELSITEDDIAEKGISLSITESPKSSITLGYKKNWTVQDIASLAGIVKDLSVGDNLNLVANYTTESSTVSATNYHIKDIFPLAEDTEIIPTYLFEYEDAINEVNRRIALRSKKRFVFKVQSTSAPFIINVGSKIIVTHKRFGFNYSKKALVVGLEEQPTKRRVNVEVWL